MNDTCQKSLSYIGPDKKVLFFVTLFLSLTVRNKGRKKKKKKQWLANILLRFSVIEEHRSLCVTSSFFISQAEKLKADKCSHSSVYRISFVSLI